MSSIRRTASPPSVSHKMTEPSLPPDAARDSREPWQQRQLDERKASAKLERENDHIARDAKEGIVQANRVARAKQQAARYVPQLEVEPSPSPALTVTTANWP